MILFHPAALFVVLSYFCPASVISLLHASFHLMFGLILLFPGMSTSSIILTMCYAFIILTWPYHFRPFLKFSWTLAPLLCPYNVEITDRIPLCHSAHPSQWNIIIVYCKHITQARTHAHAHTHTLARAHTCLARARARTHTPPSPLRFDVSVAP